MYLAQSKIEEIIKTHLIINSNTDTFANCYYKCANKDNLMQLYNKRNHEAIFGRRGTGKTTLLKALCFYTNNGLDDKSVDRCIYIDMEDVVPNDDELSLPVDATIIVETYRKLLLVFLEQFLAFYWQVSETMAYYEIKYSAKDLEKLEVKLDILSNLIFYGKKQTGLKKHTEKTSVTSEATKNAALTANVSTGMGDKSSKALLDLFIKRTHNKVKEVLIEKDIEYTLDINAIKTAIEEVIDAFKIGKLIVCIDEFTRVDKGLSKTIQPNIAQLIKDTFFRINNVSVKITSLWNRTEMQMRQLGGPRIGIELGEDAERSIDLDTMFFDDEHNKKFFKNMLINTCMFFDEDYNGPKGRNMEIPDGFDNYIVNALFTSNEVFNLLICGSQGIPRIFGNLLISSINERERLGKERIDAEVVYNCVVHNFNQNTRRKLPYTEEFVCKFDDFIDAKQSRFILISNKEYEQNKERINGLLDNNYMHQYPSEKVDRSIRNRYKVYLVHFGNYLESLGIKQWRKKVKADGVSLYPKIPSRILEEPHKFQLNL